MSAKLQHRDQSWRQYPRLTNLPYGIRLSYVKRVRILFFPAPIFYSIVFAAVAKSLHFLGLAAISYQPALAGISDHFSLRRSKYSAPPFFSQGFQSGRFAAFSVSRVVRPGLSILWLSTNPFMRWILRLITLSFLPIILFRLLPIIGWLSAIFSLRHWLIHHNCMRIEASS